MLETPIASATPQVDLLPAGGSDPTRFDCKEAWYPVFYLTDLDQSKPNAFTLLGEDVVIWWDAIAQAWRAFIDQCPHRLASLSQGRINEQGQLECPYHGWSFTGTGTCDRIPQQVEGGQAERSRRACVKSFPTAERQGLLFVYPGNPDNAAKTAIPMVEPIEENPDEWVCLNTFRDLPYDALTLLENVLDSSHLPYTHHRSVGNRANAGPVELQILESGRQGFTGLWEEGPRRGKLGRQNTVFKAPALMWHDLTSKQFGRTLTVVYATPIRKGECRLFARFPFKFPSKFPQLALKLTPRWLSHLGNNNVLEDDQIFLHHQERYLAAQGGSENFTKAFYLPTKADLFVFEFRQWVNQYHADPFPGVPLPPALSQEQLLDRYHSHTKKCASCRRALRNIQRLKWSMIGLAAIAWAVIPGLALLVQQSTVPAVIVAMALTVVTGGAGWGLHRLETKFYQGRSVPLRNLPEKS